MRLVNRWKVKDWTTRGVKRLISQRWLHIFVTAIDRSHVRLNFSLSLEREGKRYKMHIFSPMKFGDSTGSGYVFAVWHFFDFNPVC